MNGRLSSRKLILVLSALFVVHILYAFGLLDRAGYLELLKWTLGLYMGANIAEQVGVVAAKHAPRLLARFQPGDKL